MPSKNQIKNEKGKWVKFSNKDFLKNKFPKLIKEWNFKKNKNIDLNKLSHKSPKSVHWKCKKNHIWTTSPYHRTISKSGCPSCARLNAVGRKLNYPMTKIRVLYNIKRTKNPKIKQKWINKLKNFNN